MTDRKPAADRAPTAPPAHAPGGLDRRACLAAGGAALAAAATPAVAATAPEAASAGPSLKSVTGTVAYRERIAMPPEATLYVTLSDISLADAPSVTLSALRLSTGGRFPAAFTLDYDPALIDERMSYAISAQISVGRKIVFRTDTVYPVLTRGAGDRVDAMVRMTGDL